MRTLVTKLCWLCLAAACVLLIFLINAAANLLFDTGGSLRTFFVLLFFTVVAFAIPMAVANARDYPARERSRRFEEEFERKIERQMHVN